MGTDPHWLRRTLAECVSTDSTRETLAVVHHDPGGPLVATNGWVLFMAQAAETQLGERLTPGSDYHAKALVNGDVNIEDYDAVISTLGEESTDDLTFDADERDLVDAVPFGRRPHRDADVLRLFRSTDLEVDPASVARELRVASEHEEGRDVRGSVLTTLAGLPADDLERQPAAGRVDLDGTVRR